MISGNGVEFSGKFSWGRQVWLFSCATGLPEKSNIKMEPANFVSYFVPGLAALEILGAFALRIAVLAAGGQAVERGVHGNVHGFGAIFGLFLLPFSQRFRRSIACQHGFGFWRWNAFFSSDNQGWLGSRLSGASILCASSAGFLRCIRFDCD